MVFLYPPMWRFLSSSVYTVQSKMAKLLFLTCSNVNLILLSTELMYSVKAGTSCVLILTHVSSTCLNQRFSSSEGVQGSAPYFFHVEVSHNGRYCFAHGITMYLFCKTPCCTESRPRSSQIWSGLTLVTLLGVLSCSSHFLTVSRASIVSHHRTLWFHMVAVLESCSQSPWWCC